MTQLIYYAELTWLEVADLPRDCPMVLPLGDGYAWNKVSEALSNPTKMVIFPTFPYGWRGSLLYLPENVLTGILLNLLQSVRDDGFTQIFVLTPSGLDLKLGCTQIVQRINQPLSDYFSLNDLEKVVLIPIGHTEQHGYHLPLSTDTEIINAIAQGVIINLPEKSISLPVMPYGVSTHRDSFAGTLNAGGRAFEDFTLSILDALVQKGFTRFYLMSGHGGNCSFLVNVVKYAGERYPNIFCATSYLYLNTPEGIKALETHRQSAIGGMGHACELETSLMLCLRPELVHMEKVVDETEFISTPSYYMDWIEGGSLVANPPWTDDTQTGAYGAGSLGTREKGQIWLESAIREKINQVHEIEEQYQRRLPRKIRAGKYHK